MTLHPLLARQLRRHLPQEIPDELHALLLVVSETYQQLHQQLKLTEHVLETSSAELNSANAALRARTERDEQVWLRLRQIVPAAEEGTDQTNRDLLEVAADIERLIAERAANERDLLIAKDTADKASRAKGDFLANMSHEIRTPLNAVVGMTSLLLDAHLPAVEREKVEIIRQNGDALLDIINDILDFSKIEAGHMELELIPCDLRATVEQVLDLFSERAAKSKLDLGAAFAPNLPTLVVTDPTRLRQILVNLVGNALKFTPTGGVAIFLSADPTPEGNWTFHCEVEDSGIGIAPDSLDRLFKAFSQADSSTTRRYGGTGLGLAITRRLCQLLGGDISVSSQPGSGSTFRFDFFAEAAPADATLPRPLDLRLLRGRRVLVVDDIPLNLRILEHQLLAWGLTPVLCCGPEAALRTFAPDQFDVALLDFNMPSMDGAGLASELRRLHPGRVPPLVLLSSRGAHPGDSALGFTRRMTKPVKPSELLQVLREIFAEPDTGPAAPSPRPAPAVDPSQFARDHPLRILVVEDVAVNRKVIDLFLVRLGYRATLVADGLEVIPALEQSDYDLILMDVQMPGMDGLTTTRHIRARPGCADHPYVIALTAHALTEHKQEALASGMQDYLVKPIRAEALTAALARAYAWHCEHPRPGTL